MIQEIKNLVKDLKSIEFKKRELEIITTAFIFIIMVSAKLLFSGATPITGHAIFDSVESAQSSIQEILRTSEISTIGSNAKMCIIVKNNTDPVSFKVRKIGDVFNVNSAPFYCDGKENEDIVIAFESYDTLLSTKDNGLEDSIPSQDTVNPSLSIWESKYVKAGGLVTCDDDFKKKYCTFITNELSKSEMKSYGITCCNPAPTGSGKIFSFIVDYWWIFAIIVFCILLGGGAILLFSNKAEQPENFSYETSLRYIENMRNHGFGDITIAETMAKNGWKKPDIDKAFDVLRKTHLKSLNDRFKKVDTTNIFKHKSNFSKAGGFF